MYVRKTIDEWVILGNYGYGWDEMACYDSYKKAKVDFKLYLENEGNRASFRLIKRRVKKECK